MSEDKRQRFIQLSWEILEHKCRYYVSHSPTISDYDYDYDLLEKEYDTLAAELGKEPTASNMVDFDEKRPACISVLYKLGLGSGRKRRT